MRCVAHGMWHESVACGEHRSEVCRWRAICLGRRFHCQVPGKQNINYMKFNKTINICLYVSSVSSECDVALLLWRHGNLQWFRHKHAAVA